MSEKYNFSRDEYINKDNNIPTLPPHRIVTPPRQPGEPAAWQKLAALAAAIEAKDRLLDEHNLDDDYSSDSCYSSTDYDTDDSDDNDDGDDDNDYDFFGCSLPYRMRTSSLPAAIEGQKTAEVAQAMLRKLWTRKISRRSINCLASSHSYHSINDLI